MNRFLNIITLHYHRIVHLSEFLSVRTIYHAHFQAPKILDIFAILVVAAIFILTFRDLFFSIRWSTPTFFSVQENIFSLS